MVTISMYVSMMYYVFLCTTRIWKEKCSSI